MLTSNPFIKLKKLKRKKFINEKVTEIRFFDFYYCVQKFSAYKF
jgi:hypothetical protein